MFRFCALVVVAFLAFGQGPVLCAAEDVLIGYFGPASPDHPEGGDLWCAASLALDEANEAGGYRGRPFRLVTSWSGNPWGTGVADVARMAYVEQVWAIIGGIDGASVHLAEQVVAKARLVLMNAVATDKSINMASVPWMFSSVPLDDVQAAVLAKAIAADVRAQPFVIVSSIDHDSHVFTVELFKALKELELSPAFHFDCEPTAQASRGVLERAARSNPAAVVLIACASDSANLLGTLREVGYEGAVFGGPWMGRRAFVEQAGPVAEGVTFPYSLAPSPKLAEFTRRFARRFGRTPDYAAAHMYDTVSLLVAGLRRAGLDRTGIRDAIRELAPWPGVTGEIRWNTVGANCRPVHIGTIKDRQARLVATPGH
ncbi:MAG: ABC transporter substrate-binding protein [Phycisphaerales bacterium]|nr:MAG: ABC transporter substrate-binding protein [Phycisphaerales bacterium]